jgi:hypothetical protein
MPHFWYCGRGGGGRAEGAGGRAGGRGVKPQSRAPALKRAARRAAPTSRGGQAAARPLQPGARVKHPREPPPARTWRASTSSSDHVATWRTTLTMLPPMPPNAQRAAHQRSYLRRGFVCRRRRLKANPGAPHHYRQRATAPHGAAPAAVARASQPRAPRAPRRCRGETSPQPRRDTPHPPPPKPRRRARAVGAVRQEQGQHER